MDFQPSLACSKTLANKELSEKLIRVSHAYINNFNNRDFSALRSMGYLFAEGYTTDVQDWQNTKLTGWDEYVTLIESEAVFPPELSIHLKEAHAEIDFPKGRAEVFTLVEQHNCKTGIIVQARGRLVWRHEKSKGKWLAHSYVMFRHAATPI